MTNRIFSLLCSIALFGCGFAVGIAPAETSSVTIGMCAMLITLAGAVEWHIAKMADRWEGRD